MLVEIHIYAKILRKLMPPCQLFRSCENYGVQCHHAQKGRHLQVKYVCINNVNQIELARNESDDWFLCELCETCTF